jgi:membrane protease YdiL (CAAX protease family)
VEQELGPFGRSFLGEFPTRGTLAMSLFSVLLSFMLAGGLFSSLFLSIVTTFLMVYLCYNVVEPHFNAEENPRDFINDFDVLPSGLNDKMKQAYRHSGMVEIWDFTGNQISHLFERTGGVSGTDLAKPSTGKVWAKVSIVWIAVYISMYVVAIIGLVVALSTEIGDIDLFSMIVVISSQLVMFSIFLMAIFLEDGFDYFMRLFRRPNLKKASLLVIIVSFVDLILVYVYLIIYDTAVGIPTTEESFFIEASSANDPLLLFLLFIALAVCAPLFEELLFRGYILDSLRGVHSDGFAIIASGLMFGLLHYSIFGPLLLWVTQAIGGVLYAWLRIRTDSIWPSIVCHSLWNGTIFFFEYIY